MQIAARDRPKVKVQCLRLIATLKLDPARSHLIAGFVHTYLKLTGQEFVRFEREIGEVSPEERETVLTLTNEWIEIGEARGLEQGMEKGRTMEARNLVLRLGTRRFGLPDDAVKSALETASLERLEALADRLHEAESWEELFA